MAEKQGDCGCGCIGKNQASVKPANDKKKDKSSK